MLFWQEILALQGQQKTLQAGSKAYSRSWIATHFLNKAIVAAAAGYGTLSSQWRVLNLKGGLGVVVQASYQPRVMLEFYPSIGEMLLELLEVVPAFLTEAVGNLRCISHVGLVTVLLAVQDTQRAAVKAAAAVLAEIIQLVPEEILQHGPVLAAALRTAYGVDGQLQILQPKALQQAHGQEDYLSIYGWIGLT